MKTFDVYTFFYLDARFRFKDIAEQLVKFTIQIKSMNQSNNIFDIDESIEMQDEVQCFFGKCCIVFIKAFKV